MPRPLWLILLVVLLSFGWFWADGNVGINLQDEGYLWYGTSALKRGEVPMRDFDAYDPGRYVWTAAWSYVLGDDLVALRAACVLFQCLGLTCGLLAAQRVSRDWKFLLPVALALLVWFLERYKVFEQSIALMAIYIAVLLIEKPTVRRHFLTGIFVGLMAFMGRNHGVYLVVAFGLVIAVRASAARTEWPRRVLAWSGGIVVGYLPQGLMFLLAPGYLAAFVLRVQHDLAAGTNLAKPVVWPWRIPANYPGFFWWEAFDEGCFFLALPVVLVAAVVWILRLRRETLFERPLLLAATAVAIPYAHYTFSRPDYIHLSHSAPALVLVLVAMGATMGPKLARWWPASAALALFLAAAPVSGVRAGFIMKMFGPPGSLAEVKVRGRTMHIAQSSLATLRMADRVANGLAKPDEPVVFAPHWPGLYLATGRRSPLRQIYFILPASAAEEEEIVRGLEEQKVQWFVLQDYPLDGRDDLRFRHTNPRTFAFLESHFAPVAVPGTLANTVILHRRSEPLR